MVRKVKIFVNPKAKILDFISFMELCEKNISLLSLSTLPPQQKKEKTYFIGYKMRGE